MSIGSLVHFCKRKRTKTALNIQPMQELQTNFEGQNEDPIVKERAPHNGHMTRFQIFIISIYLIEFKNYY